MSGRGREGGVHRSVGFVAWRDLANEKLITLCLILSVVAVVAPILLLASVKVGFIDRLREEFIQDPSFREVRPQDPDLRQEMFFAELSGWEEVAFVAPSVMLVPREVDYVVEGSRSREEARLWPSGADDPLFERLQGEPPSGDAVVISSDIAEKSKIDIGASIVLRVSRIERDKRLTVEVPVTVAGIVPGQLLPQPTILADAALDRQVESYRAGIAVPERGWKGVALPPRQVFQRLLVAAEQDLGETVLSDLRIRVGATALTKVGAQEAAALAGSAAAPLAGAADGRSFHVLENAGRSYLGGDVDEAMAVLANTRAAVIGIGAPVSVRLLGAETELAGLDPRLFPGVGGSAAWAIRTGAPYMLNNAVYLPEDARPAWEAAGRPATVDLEIVPEAGWSSKAFTIVVRVAGFLDVDAVVGSPALLGMVRRGESVPLAFDAANANIVEQSAGFRGFRLVATTIDAVPGIVDRFQQMGMNVRAKSDEIRKLQRLERSLDTLILVVASVALAGGFAILSSSFFANVQRKRVDYATMRLIGMQKRSVFLIPVTQAVIVGALGVAGSVVVYLMVSGFLNSVIGPQLGFDGQLSKLYASHFALSGAFVLVGSCVASLAASREATRIDPAQAIRSH
jgi:putative ABC transport system permease protein